MSYHARLKRFLDKLVAIGFCYANTSCGQLCLGKIEYHQGFTNIDDDDSDDGETRCCVLKFNNNKNIIIHEQSPNVYSFLLYPSDKKLLEKFINLQYMTGGISIDWNECIQVSEKTIPVLLLGLQSIAFEEQGYTKSVSKARKAVFALILCLCKYIPKDVARLLGQYLYSTRYDVKSWKIN